MTLGRASLKLALDLLGVGSGNEVIIPSLVCGVVADAIRSVKANPVLVDVNSSNGTLDPEKLEHCITPRTKAIIPVHYQGLPCDMEAICEISRKYGIAVIEDCAHSIGSTYSNSS